MDLRSPSRPNRMDPPSLSPSPTEGAKKDPAHPPFDRERFLRRLLSRSLHRRSQKTLRPALSAFLAPSCSLTRGSVGVPPQQPPFSAARVSRVPEGPPEPALWAEPGNPSGTLQTPVPSLLTPWHAHRRILSHARFSDVQPAPPRASKRNADHASLGHLKGFRPPRPSCPWRGCRARHKVGGIHAAEPRGCC